MANDMVVDLNLHSTIAQQDNKCFNFKCRKEMNPDRIYFRMDQEAKPEVYECYCEVCGIKEEEKDRAKGRKITDESKND